MKTETPAVRWIIDSDEPWAAYRALIDIIGDDESAAGVRAEMLRHPAIATLIEQAAQWPGYPLKRHNDAAHPIYAIATLADFGLRHDDPGMERIVEAVLEHFDGEAFETLLWLPRFLTKEEDAERWTWMLCDGPTLAYSLLAFGLESHPDVKSAVKTLVLRADDNAWRCGAAESLPKFSGPGRKGDTCPIATTYVLKALSMVDDPPEAVVDRGVEPLLDHWEHQKDYKLKMFGIGTDFRKLKYPYVWYDILHVADVLSRFGSAKADSRLHEMVAEITAQADGDGRYTAGSMYRAWKDWSFADKKHPSPWLTVLALRIQHRLRAG